MLAQEFDQIIFPRERVLGQDTFLQFIAPFSLLVYSNYTQSHNCMGLGIYCVFEKGSNLHTWQPLLSCDIGKQIQNKSIHATCVTFSVREMRT